MIRFLLWLCLLTALYLIVLGHLGPWDFIAGLMVALSLLLWAAGSKDPSRTQEAAGRNSPGRLPPASGRLLAIPSFLIGIAWAVLSGWWQVLLVTSRLRPLGQPGLIEAPFGERSHQGIVVSALIVTLTPGSTLIEVNWEKQAMLLHLLDAADPERERRRLEEFYQRYQKPVFP